MNYKNILLDFDGLLVDTEVWHFRAYKQVVESFSLPFNWDFTAFLPIAHKSGDSIKKALVAAYPSLFKQISWQEFYKLKSERYCTLIESANPELMPGAHRLLTHLLAHDCCFAIVTNSSKKQVNLIKERSDLLRQVKHWFVREDYDKPKPSPDGYVKAITTLNMRGPILGFEDTRKGLEALVAANVQPVLICDPKHPQRADITHDHLYFSSLDQCLDSSTL